MVNQDPNLSNLAINSPKDYSESDDDVFNENLNAKAKASKATKSTSGSSILVTKSTTGSTKSNQAEALANKPTSKTADVYMQDEEKKDTKEEEDKMEEKQEEVEEVKEVKGRSSEVEKDEENEDRMSSSSGAGQMAATDKRYREVKTEI